MSIVPGTYRGGRVDLDSPVDWVEGIRVEVTASGHERVGRAEDEWPDTPEGREALLARFDAIDPLEFTPEEETEIAAARAEVRDVTLRAVRKKMELE